MSYVQAIDNDNADGSRFGQDSSSLIAFCGGTPRAQYSFSGTAGTLSISAATVSACGMSVFGFSSSAQFDALISGVKDIRNLLSSFGLGA